VVNKDCQSDVQSHPDGDWLRIPTRPRAVHLMTSVVVPRPKRPALPSAHWLLMT